MRETIWLNEKNKKTAKEGEDGNQSLRLRGSLRRDAGVSAPLPRTGDDASDAGSVRKDGHRKVPRAAGNRPVRRGTSGGYPVYSDCSRSLTNCDQTAFPQAAQTGEEPGALSQEFTRKRLSVPSPTTQTGICSSRAKIGQRTLTEILRKHKTNHLLPAL